MSSRPDIALALDVRSHETIFLISTQEAAPYPEAWVRIASRHDLGLIVPDSVVVVDRVELQRRTLAAIADRGPRLVALLPSGVEQEKSMRRLVSAMFPWAEVWTVSTSLGKALVSKDIVGRPYDRFDIFEGRAEA